MNRFVMNMIASVLKNTKCVKKITGFFLIMTGFVSNVTVFVLDITAYVLHMGQKDQDGYYAE